MKMLSFFVLLFLVSCSATEAKKVSKTPEPDIPQTLTAENYDVRIAEYFSGNAVDPHILINNIHLSEEMDIAEGGQLISLGNYTIKWINTEEEVKIQIGQDLFSLKGQETINDTTDDTEKGEVDFANNWEQARLYDYNGRELIVISMIYHPCVGRGCGIKFILVYDVRTKTKNFFGCFRGTDATDLYRFSDGKLRYAANTYHEGFDERVNDMAVSHMKTLYELNENGVFFQNRDNRGAAYFIKNTMYLDKKETSIEVNWLYKI